VLVVLAFALAGVVAVGVVAWVVFRDGGAGDDPESPPGPRAADPLEIASRNGDGPLRRESGQAPIVPADRPVLGLTLTQDTQVEQSDAKSLTRPGPLVNVHVMGFGVDNPEPSRGSYDWSSLDDRMDLVRASGATPVITLCCAPDWMKGGKAGDTDWSRLEDAPRKANYDDFADLAVAVAERYRDVRYFMVWNEFKGFYDDAENRWDHEAYTEMYNVVYAALKKHDERLRVGGPYIVVENWSKPDSASHASNLTGSWGVVDQRSLDAVDYWLDNATGADFVVVDGGSDTKDAGVVGDPVTGATDFFGAVTGWLRQRTDLPVWWAEWYAEAGNQNPDRRATVMRAGIASMRKEGAEVALLWWSEHTAAACWYCKS
jgi:hypothetical protein